MGIRADYYIDKANHLLWLGSQCYDGYELNDKLGNNDISYSDHIKFIENRRNSKDWVHTYEDWPWLWDDSKLSDYAYIWRKDKLEIYEFGKPLNTAAIDAAKENLDAEGRYTLFPNMRTINTKKVG